MKINHNLTSIFANRELKFNNKNLDSDIEKLVSGQRINKAADDACRLAVSEKIRAHIRGAYQAEKNAENGISLIQTAEGYLHETQDIIQRLRELAVQSANGILTNEEREYIQKEVNELIDEIDRIASMAQFNGLNLLTGKFADSKKFNNIIFGSMWFHIGAKKDQREQIFLGTITTQALGLKEENGLPSNAKNQISLSTINNANLAISSLDNALKKINSQRANIGGYQNRLEEAIKKLVVEAENLQSAESIIRDANMAEEIVKYSKNKILVETTSNILKLSNIRPEIVVKLLES